MEFPRQKYWSGLPFPPIGDLPNPGIRPTCPGSPALQVNSLPLSHWGIPPVPKLFHCYLSNAQSIITEDPWLSLENTSFSISLSDDNCSLFCGLLHWAYRRNERPLSLIAPFFVFSLPSLQKHFDSEMIRCFHTPLLPVMIINPYSCHFWILEDFWSWLFITFFCTTSASWWYQCSSSPIWSF